MSLLWLTQYNALSDHKAGQSLGELSRFPFMGLFRVETIGESYPRCSGLGETARPGLSFSAAPIAGSRCCQCIPVKVWLSLREIVYRVGIVLACPTSG